MHQASTLTAVGQETASTDAMTPMHVLAVCACAVGFIFDLADISFGSALASIFSASPGAVSRSGLSWLLASLYIGAIFGPPFMGAFADRHGRRKALAATLLSLSALSFASATCRGVGSLTIMRGLSGIALGAYPPLMITFLTDILPARLRGRLIMLTVAISYLGPPGAIFLMRWLTPLSPLGLAGWRWVLALDGLGALAGALLFLALPESATWRRAATAAPDRPRPMLRHFAMVAALSFLAPWATVAFPLLSGVILVARGVSLSNTLLYLGISTFGPILGSLVAVSFADRLQRRTAIIICAVGMAVSAIGFYASASAAGIMVTSFAFNLCVSLYMPALNVYAAELFPTRLRGRATSWAWSANRLAAAAVPLALLPWLHVHGAAIVFAVIVASLVGGLALVGLYGPPGEAGHAVA